MRADLKQSTAIVGASAAASRVLGFARDVLVAALLGAGPAADAFVVAFRIPGLVRRVFGEGALNGGFVPVEQRIRRDAGDEAARRFAGEALSAVGWGLLGVLAVGEVLAGLLVLALASGYAGDPQRLDLATLYTRLMLPLIPATVLAALVSALLNARGKVLVAAVAPVAVNAVLIVVLAALSFAPPAPERLGTILALAVTAGGVAQLLVLWPALARLPHPPRWGLPSLGPDVRRMLALSLPALAVAGAAQLSIVAATQVASATPAAVARLYYADRLFQLPLGFVASAAGVVLLPALVRLQGDGRAHEAHDMQNRALEMALFLSLPAGVGLWVLAGPIVSVLFQRGAFGAEDVAQTAAALAALAPGLPAAALVRVLSQGFFARESIRWPLGAALAGVASSFAAALALAPAFGVAGIATGVSIGAWMQALLLAAVALSTGTWRPDARLVRRAALQAVAAGVMAFAVGTLRDEWATWLEPAAGLPWRVAALAGLCAAGIVAHVGAAFTFGAITLAELSRR